MNSGIEALLRDFYGRAREDALLGPIFNAAVDDWEYHIQNVVSYWHRQTIAAPAYQRTFPSRHKPLALKKEHFLRWLELFQSTAQKHYSMDIASEICTIAKRIAIHLYGQVLPQQPLPAEMHIQSHA